MVLLKTLSEAARHAQDQPGLLDAVDEVLVAQWFCLRCLCLTLELHTAGSMFSPLRVLGFLTCMCCSVANRDSLPGLKMT